MNRAPPLPAPPRLSRDGEPLCIPPSISPGAQGAQGADPPARARLSEAARRRLPEVEAELRRRLSGSDRSIEAQELERHVSGERSRGAYGGPLDPRGPDALLESGLWALCAGSLLGLPVSLPLAEALALRGVRTTRGALAQEHPPRALDALGALARGQALAGRSGDGSQPLEGGGAGGAALEIIRPLPTQALTSQAARVQIALAAAGLSRPLVVVASAGEAAPDEPAQAAGFLHAGLPRELLELIQDAAAPHPVYDAAPMAAALRAALDGRNPWLLFRIAELPWRGPGDEALAPLPVLTPAGEALLQQALASAGAGGADGDPLPRLLLACLAIAAAERLSHLAAPPYEPELLPPDRAAAAPAPAPGPRRLPSDAALDVERARILDALQRLISRPLNPGQDGEAPLFLAQAARALREGLALLEAHHPEELGRLLVPAAAGCARVRLFSFPREAPQALVVHGRHVSGGDLRAHIDLLPPAPGAGLLAAVAVVGGR